MEVASPLTFGHVKAGSKRRFATCSPLNTPAIEPNVDDYAMDDSSAYGSSFKRRRCDNMEMSHVPTPNMNNPFGSSQLSSPQVHTPAFGNKRQRNEESQDGTNRQIRNIIDRQNTEIRKLKSEKQSVENSYKELSAFSDKHQKENTALKKVLAIKQERQEQFVTELDNARRYREQAEQLIAVLRQHLNAQQTHGNHAGIGFNNGGPPNVY